MSDLHLGHRRFPVMVEGRIAREVDVERAWSHAVDRIIEAQPDLLTVAGDVYDVAQPSMHALMAFFEGIRRVVNETNAHVVVIPGNHDAGRTAEILTPIAIIRGEVRVHVVTDYRDVSFVTMDGETVVVACFPFSALTPPADISIDPPLFGDVHVMLIHAAVRTSEVEGALPHFYAGDFSLDVGKQAEHWDVIAAGDFHEFRRLHPTRLAFYSGSIERTASNMWDEDEEKGVVVYDTKTGEIELRAVPNRPVNDIGYAPDAERSAAAVNALMVGLLQRPDLTDAIVRLKVDRFPREERMQVDQALVRQLKSRCFWFQLDISFEAREAVAAGDRRTVEPQPITTSAQQFFAADPEPVRECALSHLAEAGA